MYSRQQVCIIVSPSLSRHYPIALPFDVLFLSFQSLESLRLRFHTRPPRADPSRLCALPPAHHFGRDLRRSYLHGKYLHTHRDPDRRSTHPDRWRDRKAVLRSRVARWVDTYS